ncbi:DUF11 domain-containing protein [Catenulispora sp. NL8]|uniref:DUF11 domain-containing protein n=2 Tax=Catenulispora pinistramenti TaxID=2705254 RepID=A0ABS5L5S1_9ACTN|nr:DUF11 domain-containing protein [Catenulispora pinistramenti]MBS2553659.1 DUF11 domain-containing protein [Catenulispora pinistramenti]
MMRSAAAIGVVTAAAMTVGTMSTLAARAGALPTLPTDASATGTGQGVRVDISDDTRSAHSGDLVDYTVRVDNESPTSYPALEVYHLLPPGFQLVDSSPQADQEDDTLRWTANVPAGHTLVFTDQVMAGTVEESEHLAPRVRDAKPAPTTHQFTSTACAKSSATGPALACGTVREQLTDGPDAAAGATGANAKHWQPGLLGVGLMAAMYAAFRGFFRKRQDAGGEEG